MTPETYQANLKRLFEKWQQNTGLSIEGKTFSPDGIVCPEIWFNENNKPKILFVLKETNRWCNLCKYVVKENAKWQTWNNIARWTYLLRHLHDKSIEEIWQHVKSINTFQRINNLNHIALVNIKKRPGGKSTNSHTLIEEFKRSNKTYILDEIALFGHVDYIVCCGKGIAHCISQCYNSLRWKNKVAITPEGTVVIDFLHPQARSKKKDMLKQLYELASQASRPTA